MLWTTCYTAYLFQSYARQRRAVSYISYYNRGGKGFIRADDRRWTMDGSYLGTPKVSTIGGWAHQRQTRFRSRSSVALSLHLPPLSRRIPTGLVSGSIWGLVA